MDAAFRSLDRCENRREASVAGDGGNVSGFEAEGVFLDDGVDEDLAGDAVEFGLGGGLVGVVEREEEVLALADVGDAGVVHAAQSVGDGLALRIEDGTLQRDVDMGFHLRIDYRLVEYV